MRPLQPSAASAEPASTASAEPASATPPEEVKPPAPRAPRAAALPRRKPAPERSPAGIVELSPAANDEFDDESLADLSAALHAVEESAFSMLFRKTKDEEGKTIEKFAHPDNCRSWRYFKTRGYSPKSALAKQVDAGALVRCGALEFLSRAAPSRVSHVSRLLAGAGPESVPAIVASAPSKLAQRSRSSATSKGWSLAEMMPDALAGKSELPGRVSIIEPASATSVMLNAEAWGDVNGDEVEDVLVSVMSTSDDGTWLEMRLLEVTRPSPTAPWNVLSISR